ncbi:MAG: tRNA lysidine(34) synthetase TilS [Rhodospirillales bacterium]|nr:tRNA lysidine(34) synthetase TilS [Rhodospirillales bacterium]
MDDPLSPDFFSRRLSRLGLAADSRLALAVSGGPDSMALALLAADWVRSSGRSDVPALIVDHGLRPDSAQEAEMVAARLGPIVGLCPEILRLSLGNPRTGVMEKARDGRYACLAARCSEEGISFLLLAHHQDDQAETLLMRLAKGSGLDGLCGMRAVQTYDSRLTLIRPFLDVPKRALVATCKAFDVPYVSDPSNENEHYLRPRLRKAMKALEKDGLSAPRLAVTAARLGRARVALETISARAFEETRLPDGFGSVCLDAEVLKQWPEEIRLRVILLALSVLDPDFVSLDIRLEKLEKIVDLLFLDEPFPRRSLGGFLFSRTDGVVTLERERL